LANVITMTQPALYDTVELLVDLPACQLRAGARGTLVLQHTADIYEVEFTDEDGQTVALCALPAEQFIVVWRNANHSWVPAHEQTAEIVSRLREPDRREVLDFARFLRLRGAQQHAPHSEPVMPVH
jgi:hypothetical protein